MSILRDTNPLWFAAAWVVLVVLCVMVVAGGNRKPTPPPVDEEDWQWPSWPPRIDDPKERG